ncbi:MAG: hypothetical protein HUU10_04505 [Bacteroidetes bacterium]|nr:hypothetical protein [Bacteroidota bacterium]
MGGILIDGKLVKLPGTYVTTKVQESGTPVFSNFNIAAIVGEHFMGPVYSATPDDIIEMIPAFSSPSEAARVYSEGDMITQFRQMRKKTTSPVLILGMGKVTKVSFTLVDDATPTPNDVVTLTSKLGGIPTNAIYMAITAVGNVKTVTITPPHLIKRLVADAASGAKVLKLTNVDGLYPGKTMFLSKSGTGTPASITIESVDSVNNTVTLTAAIGAAYSTANFSFIFDKDLSSQEKASFDTMTLEQFTNWINTNSRIFTAEIETGATTAPVAFAEKHVASITGATPATNTALVDADWLTFTDEFFGLAEAYYAASRLKIRHLLIKSTSATHHGYLKTMAANMRADGWPIQVWTGVALGDHNQAESASTHPIARAKALASQDIILAGHGLDGLSAALSLAPRALGEVLAADTTHNLTNDNMDAVQVEKLFGTSNKLEAERWLSAGVLFCQSKADGFRVTQGVNTYQDQNRNWNAQEKATYLIMQRQLADEWNADARLNFEDLHGADNLTLSLISGRAVAFRNTKVDLGKVTEETTVSSITKTENGWRVAWDVHFPSADDFIELVTNIIA